MSDELDLQNAEDALAALQPMLDATKGWDDVDKVAMNDFIYSHDSSTHNNTVDAADAILNESWFKECPRDEEGHCLGGPSHPDERKKKGKDALPAPIDYKDPPPKVPREGEFKRPVGDSSQTRLGDQAEAAVTSLGFRNILPPGKRTFSAKEVEKFGSSVDLEFDHSGKIYELKMCATTSSEYRLKAKAEEKEAKKRFEKNSKTKLYTMIAVRDASTGLLHVYTSKEPGLTGAEVSEKNFNYHGAVKL
jgi:hypothetical protein